MSHLNRDLCVGCGKCALVCPTGAIEKDPPKVRVENKKCVSCGICEKVCPTHAWSCDGGGEEARAVCDHCPVECKIAEGECGACQRYRNVGGKVVKIRPVVVREYADPYHKEYEPLITGINAGTNYPDVRPAPYIVQKKIDGVDVVTVVTETPLTYSSMLLKIDTDLDGFPEGARVLRDGCDIGMVETEQYGAKMLAIGGGNVFSGDSRLNACMACKTIADVGHRERIHLKIRGGADLEIKLGEAPVVNGVKGTIMRVGCGSATTGIFARHLKEVVDESIILDHLVTGLLTEHKAGEEVGCVYSGVTPFGNRSTRGRYFGEHGSGWGGTSVTNPRDAIKSIDMTKAWPGMTILVTETTGEHGALFEVQADGDVKEIPMTPKVRAKLDLISSNCENSMVSAMFVGGFGGSARAGVTNNPILLTKAVHDGRARFTCGGESVYILPGGNITFMVDVGKLPPDAITWCATPAPCIAGEYTMTLETYREIQGHLESVRPLEDVLQNDPVEIAKG